VHDSEVGERWRESKDDENRPYGTTGQAIVQALIRKLVDERQRERWLTKQTITMTQAREMALTDFCIQLDDWNA